MSNVLVILSGSIACYKACDAISRLVQRGHAVRTVLTQSARQFVGTATLEALTREKVAVDLFAPGEALDHISLTRWADLVVVCPATAHLLNRMAAGFGDDLAGALLLAHDWSKPLYVAPAMNPAMWQHPATRDSITRLRRWGVRFIEPGRGRTACGEVGEGRLAEPEEIVAALEEVVAKPARRLRVLVTAGGTSEPVDGVRVLTNTSSGETGALIAAHFRNRGHDVLLVRAHNAVKPDAPVPEMLFTTFRELDDVLSATLASERFDAVVHAAAVSDFSVDAVEVDGIRLPPAAGKIPSSATPVIRLQRNPKLLDGLRARSRNPDVRVVGFKLTHQATPDAARAAVSALWKAGGTDFVVYNDLAWRTDVFPAEIWSAHGVVARCADRVNIGPELERILLEDTGPGRVMLDRGATPNLVS